MDGSLAFQTDYRTTSDGRGGFRTRIGGGPKAAGLARDRLAKLQANLDSPLLESVRLLVTELITNSVRHAGASTVDLAVMVGRERVRVEVANAGVPFEPAPRDSPDEGELDSGWGLFLVDRLSDAWGVTDDAGCQRVWFEIKRI